MFAKYELSELDIAEQGIGYAGKLTGLIPMYDYRGMCLGESTGGNL